MPETYSPPDPDPRARLYSPKGFEDKPQLKVQPESVVAPDDSAVAAVAAAAKMIGVPREEFADHVWGGSTLSVTREQRYKFLQPDKPEETKEK